MKLDQPDSTVVSGTQFQRLVSEVRDYAIFLLDRHGHVATWNAGAEHIKGYKAKEIIGKHFSIFYPQEKRDERFPDQELEVAAKVGRFEDEGWRLRKDGSRFWANVVITAIRNSHGQVVNFLKITRDLTERKEAEENARRLLQEEAARRAAEQSIREAERAQREERRQREQLHVTLTSIGDGVIVCDPTGRITFMNPVAESLTGWTASEAAGKPLTDVFRIINEITRKELDNPVEKVLREGIIVGLANHTVLIARDGRELPIDDSAAPIRGEQATLAGVVLVFRDVTEARRAGEARLHLAAIVESSDDAIISHTLEGEILSWNRAAERLYEYTAEEVIGKPLSILAPPDHPDDVQENLERLRHGERIDHYETVRVAKDGRRVDVSLTISPIRNTEGRIIGASKIARDITVRKREEAALRFLASASKLLSEVLDVSSTLDKVASVAVPEFADWCAVDMFDGAGTLKRLAAAHVDPAKRKLAADLYQKYPPNPAEDRGVWHILRTGKTEFIPAISDELLVESVRDPELLETIRELGLRSYIGTPLSVRGKTVGVLTFIMAESGRNYTPQDVRVAEDLAHRASIAIENAQLYSDLRTADRRKDEFLAMLAHELRNPLAPIRNALHVMSMPGASAEIVEQARQMTERQVRHMVRLVDDLLDVSRIMRGRIELRRESVDLGVVIARAVEITQSIIDAQGQELILQGPTEPTPLWADATRLMQVIGNLLHNAAKFSSRAGRIWLTAERDGDEALIRIRDEGAGIPPEVLPHVFDLFVQGDSTLERSRGGLGVGLTVARRLVEMHGGTIRAQSAGTDRGSEFVVRLPILHDRAPTTANLAGPASHKIAPRRVLVVDDNVDAAESIAIMMRLWGHEVRTVHNGSAALAEAAAMAPQVILLDIGLPGMNGYEVARQLRQQPQFDHTKLIAITGYGQKSDRARSEEAGFDHHLTKPIDPEKLQELIAKSR